jgi:hypothetical protein
MEYVHKSTKWCTVGTNKLLCYLRFDLPFQRSRENTAGETLEVILSEAVCELCHSLNAQNVHLTTL